MFYDEFNKFWVDSLEKRGVDLGFSKHEILTLASIVKGETDLSEEMPRIAGVYHNRLRIGMKLQVCGFTAWTNKQPGKGCNFSGLISRG
jgi:UPF0755 protein